MVKFKEFKIGKSYILGNKKINVCEKGIFDIVPTKKKINANNVKFNGKYPYVARGESNNGIRGKIDYDKSYLNPSNTISFGQDTATLYYQPDPYFTGDKIQILKLNDDYGKLTPEIALYLISAIKKVFGIYSWGQQSFAVDKIANTKIKLPIKSNESPDWQYMNERISELEHERISELEHYLQVTGLNDYHLSEEDKSILTKKIKMKDFRIGDLFVIKKGKRLTKANQIKGEIPFVGSSSINNGITAYISNNKYMHPAGSITVTYNGSVGQSFLQDKDFWASDDVNVLYTKQPVSKETKLYLITSLKKLSIKYSYTFKWTKEKMENDIISLPVKNNSPDWQYMEQYIKVIEKLTIKNVVDYKDQVIKLTNQVVNQQ